MIKLTFFTRPNCSLCDAAKFVVDRVAHHFEFDFEAVDISEAGNARWHKRYEHHIPVLHINGEERFRHRFNERELKQALRDLIPQTE